MNVSDDYQILEKENIKDYKEINCILGMTEICNQQFLLIVNHSLKIGKIKNYQIFQIQKVDLIKLSKDDIYEKNKFDIIKTDLQKLLSNGTFFYSIAFDLSSYTQKIFFEYNNNNIDDNSFLSKVNQNYLWNFNLLSSFAQYQIDKNFISFCICGFVGYKTINLNENQTLEFIIIERFNQKYIFDQNFMTNEKYNIYSLNFRQIEIIFPFRGGQIFSFLFYYSFFPFFLDNQFHNHYSNIINFSKEVENYKNILGIISSEEKISNSLLYMLKDHNSNLNKLQCIEVRNYNFNSIEKSNSFINFTDYFSFYLGPNKKILSTNQFNIYWLISINNKNDLDDNCLNVIVRLSWIFLRKIFHNLNLKDIGTFSNSDNNNPILKNYKDIYLVVL